MLCTAKYIVVGGHRVKASTNKLACFKHKGIVCAMCGRKGAYWKIEKPADHVTAHLNLYSEDGVLMTMDHIIPKKNGGLDMLDNLQTLCAPCNVKKGSKMH